MPTATERAQAEKLRWVEVSEHWTRSATPDLWDDRPPIEKDVIRFHDPHRDLTKRAGDWGYELPGDDLPALASFAAGLASAEADGWKMEKPDLATRAYESRRFLLADRLIHWAVPWLDAVGRTYPNYQEPAHADRDMLLDLGDEGRVAPSLPGREGIRVTGEDSFGPIQQDRPLQEWSSSLWSGVVLLGCDLEATANLAGLYELASTRWADLATLHPGTAEFWEDLSLRATTTVEQLGEIL